MAQRGCSGIYQAPTDPSRQFGKRKGDRMQNHQDKDAPRSYVGHIRNLQAKSPHIRKRKTRIVPTDDEGLQDRN